MAVGRPKGTTKKAVETVKIAEPTAETKREYSKKVQIPQDYEIPVRSNVQGILVYVSRKTGYTVEWGALDDTAYIEYSELVAIRNTARKFFEDNWIIIDDSDDYTAEQILYTLGVDKYYKEVSELHSVDDIFDMSVSKLKEIVPTLSNGYKTTIASRAMALIAENDERLDSNAKPKALEELLGVKFENEI